MTPRLGSTEQFSALRRFLLDAGYTEPAILDRMGIRSLSESLRMYASGPPGDAAEVLIRLFLLGDAVPLATVRRHVPADALALLADLGLAGARGEALLANVALYPCCSLYILSDRNREPELAGTRDKVFAAITPNTEEFLAMLPDDPCPAFLDLCSGTAIAALDAAARYAVQAYAFDLSHRSAHFAECNRRLNQLPNVTIGQGDLYAPAGRRTFDRIVAHPPYVPSLRPTQLLRDGGEDGEALTRRIIAGLPAYLHPGGRFYGLALAAHVRGEALAERIRGWLHEAQAEFDVAVVIRKELNPERLIFDNWAPHAQAGDLLRWQSVLENGRIDAFHYVSLILQRRAESRPVVTITRRAGAPYQPREVESLLRWEVSGASPGGLRPVVRPGISMEACRRLEGSRWGEECYRYRIENPFRATHEGPAWIAEFLARCDGSGSVRRHFEALRPDLPYEVFAQTVRALISEGFLRPGGEPPA